MAVTENTPPTYNFVNITLDQIITESFMRCGIVGDVISALQSIEARRSLNFLGTEWTNKGINLWTIEQNMFSLVTGQAQYSFPAGFVDIADNEMVIDSPTRVLDGTASSSSGNAANAFDANSTTGCVQDAPNGYISYSYGTNLQPIVYIGIQTGVSTSYNIQVSCTDSNGNELYATLTGATNYTAGQITWFVLPNSPSGSVWTITETAGGTLNIKELYFSIPYNSRMLWRLSRSEYIAIPNKSIPAPPSSFYVNRQITPVTSLYPTPDGSETAIIYNSIMQIPDFITLTGTNLYVPQRFLDALCAGLSYRLSLKFAKPQVEQLKTLYEEAYGLASLADEEKVPLRFQPDFLRYQAGIW